MLLGTQYLQYVRSGGTANVRFPQIFAAAVHILHRCLVSLCHCMKTAWNNITDRLLICIVNIIGVFLHASLPEVEGLHALDVYSKFSLFSHLVGLCKHESGNSALPDMPGPVDQSGASVWNRVTGAAVS
ncbi:hypothetical protein T06_8673 [Trichinella sp. T6]|nr:hypothetical protein T06_8673 [Trichinella sp. T6]